MLIKTTCNNCFQIIEPNGEDPDDCSVHETRAEAIDQSRHFMRWKNQGADPDPEDLSHYLPEESWEEGEMWVFGAEGLGRLVRHSAYLDRFIVQRYDIEGEENG